MSLAKGLLILSSQRTISFINLYYCLFDAEAETPILWPPHAKSWLIGKNSDAGRDGGQEEKGMTALFLISFLQ